MAVLAHRRSADRAGAGQARARPICSPTCSPFSAASSASLLLAVERMPLADWRPAGEARPHWAIWAREWLAAGSGRRPARRPAPAGDHARRRGLARLLHLGLGAVPAGLADHGAGACRCVICARQSRAMRRKKARCRSWSWSSPGRCSPPATRPTGGRSNGRAPSCPIRAARFPASCSAASSSRCWWRLSPGHCPFPRETPCSARPGSGSASRSKRSPSRWNELVSQFGGPGDDSGGSYSAFGESFRLGGHLQLSDDPVMLLQPAGGAMRPAYLAGQRYDAYDGHGWATTVDETFQEIGSDGRRYSSAHELSHRPGRASLTGGDRRTAPRSKRR